MVCSLTYLAKELVIQKIRLSFEKRILKKQSKIPDGVALLCKLMSSPSREEEGISRSSPAQESLQAEILSAFETEQQTTQFAEDLYKRLAPSKEIASSLRFDEDIWARYGLSDSKPTTCDAFKKAILMIREESYGATDVMRAIDDLNGLCWLVVLVLWAVTAGKHVTMSTARGLCLMRTQSCSSLQVCLAQLPLRPLPCCRCLLSSQLPARKFWDLVYSSS